LSVNCGPREADAQFDLGAPLHLPARIAEYVVVHEMVHLHEPHHTPEYWRRVERAMPDFALRRDWLSAHGMEVEGL